MTEIETIPVPPPNRYFHVAEKAVVEVSSRKKSKECRSVDAKSLEHEKRF
jgi:hypothetical protein